MDSDKVLVMEAGEAVEFDSPHELLKNPEGYLSKMLKETGPSMEAKLRKIADEAFMTQRKIDSELQQDDNISNPPNGVIVSNKSSEDQSKSHEEET